MSPLFVTPIALQFDAQAFSVMVRIKQQKKAVGFDLALLNRTMAVSVICSRPGKNSSFKDWNVPLHVHAICITRKSRILSGTALRAQRARLR
jgi:hypothetical protein